MSYRKRSVAGLLLSAVRPRRRPASPEGPTTARVPLTDNTAAMLFLWTVSEGNQPRIIGGELYATVGSKSIKHPTESLSLLERERMILLPEGDGVRITNHGRRALDRWKVKMYGTSKVRLVEVKPNDPR